MSKTELLKKLNNKPLRIKKDDGYYILMNKNIILNKEKYLEKENSIYLKLYRKFFDNISILMLYMALASVLYVYLLNLYSLFQQYSVLCY